MRSLRVFSREDDGFQSGMPLIVSRQLLDTTASWLLVLLILGTFVRQTVPDSQPSLNSYGSNLWTSIMSKEQRFSEGCSFKPAVSKEHGKRKVFDDSDEPEEQKVRYPDNTVYRTALKAEGYTRVVGGWGRANPEKLDEHGVPEELPVERHVSMATHKVHSIVSFENPMRVTEVSKFLCCRAAMFLTLVMIATRKEHRCVQGYHEICIHT